jgi:hypothetical protein
MTDEIDEPIEGGKESPLENTSTDVNTGERPSPIPEPEPPEHSHPEAKQPRSEPLEATVEKAKDFGKQETRNTRSINTEFQDMDLSPQGRKDVEEIKQKIKRGEELPPILVSKSGHLQDGRHRLKAYQEMGIEEVPVVYGNHPSSKVTKKKQSSNVQEEQYKTHMFADEESRQTTTQVPKHEPAPQPFSGGDPFSEMNKHTEYGYGQSKPAEKPYSQHTGAYQNKSSNADLFDQMNKDTEKQSTTGIDFEAVGESNDLAAKRKKIADYQKTQPSMEAEIEAKRKENRDKQTLEDYKKNRGAVGKVMDMFSREHTQELGYKVEKKIEGHLAARRAEKELENKRRIEPLLIQNDQNLREGKITPEMHTIREKQYLEKMEDITPLEEKIGKGVKREANSAFGILNEIATSPEGRNKINAQRVKEGKAPLKSAMDDNSIAATFARGVASTSKQLHTKPAKSQPAIFTRASEAPKFSGAAMHTLPTSSSFYGVGVGTVAAPRKGKGSRSGVSQKGGNPINFGGVGGVGGNPISFGGGNSFALFGRGDLKGKKNKR